MAARRGGGGDVGGGRDERAREDMGDDKGIGCAVAERGMGGPRRHGQSQPSAAPAERDMVDRSIIAGHENTRGVDVRRDHLRARPQGHRGESEKSRPRAAVGEVAGDRKSVAKGKSVSESVDLGGRRIINKKKNKTQTTNK